MFPNNNVSFSSTGVYKPLRGRDVNRPLFGDDEVRPLLICRGATAGRFGVRYDLAIFENPYGAPRPTESENPPATKKEIPKTRKPRLSPKINARSPKVNVKDF